MSGLSENFSEKQQRGRPRLLPPWLEGMYRDETGSYCSPRTVHNMHYYLQAMQELDFYNKDAFPKQYLWLCDPEKQIKGVSEKQGFRKTILAELGRIDDGDDLRAVALQVCQLKPKASDAILMIRQWRTGKKGAGDVGLLVTDLCRCVDHYRKRYPDASYNQIRSALNKVNCLMDRLEGVEAAEQASKKGGKK